MVEIWLSIELTSLHLLRMRAERAAKSEKKSSKKDKKVEGNKKEANKKEHCLSASRVFDSARLILSEEIFPVMVYPFFFLNFWKR